MLEFLVLMALIGILGGVLGILTKICDFMYEHNGRFKVFVDDFLEVGRK